MTAVKFSAEYPHGKAVALFDSQSASLKVNEVWLGFPGILLAFLLYDPSRNESNSQFSADRESTREMDNDSKQYANTSSEEDKTANQIEEIKDAMKATPQAAYISDAVAQVEVMAGKNIGVIKYGTGEQNYSYGSKAIMNSTICSNCVGPVGSESAGHIILEDARSAHCGGCGSCRGGCGSQSASSIFLGDLAKSAHCGGCGSCRGGCGGCGSQSASSIFLGDVAKSAHCGGCGSCHGDCGGSGSCHSGS